MKRIFVRDRRLCVVYESCREMIKGSFVISRCSWCPHYFARHSYKGRPPKYCSKACARYARSHQRRMSRVAT